MPCICCHVGFSLVVAHGGCPLVAGFSLQWLLSLRSTGSVVVAHGLSCSSACAIFSDQGSNPCFLHWQADSLALSQQGSPHTPFKTGRNVKKQWSFISHCSFPLWFQLPESLCQGDSLTIWISQPRSYVNCGIFFIGRLLCSWHHRS